MKISSVVIVGEYAGKPQLNGMLATWLGDSFDPRGLRLYAVGRHLVWLPDYCVAWLED